MKILHPDFNEPKELVQLEKYKEEGVYSIIPKQEKERLNYFLKSFENYRGEFNQKIIDATLYDNLPFSIKDKSWKSKQNDVKIIDKLIGNKEHLKVLDFGAWNGWLANYLSKKGHTVVATDVFLDPFDGLKAVNNYKPSFTALHLLPEDLWRIQDSFDLIVFNRNWAYIQHKEKMLSIAKKLLSKEGKILFTGLTFYKNPSEIIVKLNKLEAHFKEKYNIPILFFPSKGYLDYKDYSDLKKETMLYPYNRFIVYLKKFFFNNKNHQFAIYQEK